MKKTPPSIDAWLQEAKAHESAPKIGMYLTHNGTVRQTAKAKVRYGAEDTKEVTGMLFSYDQEKVDAIIADSQAGTMVQNDGYHDGFVVDSRGLLRISHHMDLQLGEENLYFSIYADSENCLAWMETYGLKQLVDEWFEDAR